MFYQSGNYMCSWEYSMPNQNEMVSYLTITLDLITLTVIILVNVRIYFNLPIWQLR